MSVDNGRRALEVSLVGPRCLPQSGDTVVGRVLAAESSGVRLQLSARSVGKVSVKQAGRGREEGGGGRLACLRAIASVTEAPQGVTVVFDTERLLVWSRQGVPWQAQLVVLNFIYPWIGIARTLPLPVAHAPPTHPPTHSHSTSPRLHSPTCTTAGWRMPWRAGRPVPASWCAAACWGRATRRATLRCPCGRRPWRAAPRRRATLRPRASAPRSSSRGSR